MYITRFNFINEKSSGSLNLTCHGHYSETKVMESEEIDTNQKAVCVKEAKGKADALWLGSIALEGSARLRAWS